MSRDEGGPVNPAFRTVESRPALSRTHRLLGGGRFEERTYDETGRLIAVQRFDLGVGPVVNRGRLGVSGKRIA